MVETVPFDLAKYLRRPEFAAEYLDGLLNEGDIAEIHSGIRDLVRAYGVATVAESTGLSREAIYRAFGPKGNPSLGTLLIVLKAVGVKLSVAVKHDSH